MVHPCLQNQVARTYVARKPLCCCACSGGRFVLFIFGARPQGAACMLRRQGHRSRTPQFRTIYLVLCFTRPHLVLCFTRQSTQYMTFNCGNTIIIRSPLGTILKPVPVQHTNDLLSAFICLLYRCRSLPMPVGVRRWEGTTGAGFVDAAAGARCNGVRVTGAPADHPADAQHLVIEGPW